MFHRVSTASRSIRHNLPRSRSARQVSSVARPAPACCPRTRPTCSTSATTAAACRCRARRCWCARASASTSRSRPTTSSTWCRPRPSTWRPRPARTTTSARSTACRRRCCRASPPTRSATSTAPRATTSPRPCMPASAHDMFGDLTTVSFSFSVGNNDVFRNVKDADGNKAQRPGVPRDPADQGLQRRRLADHHQEPDPLGTVRGDHRRRLANSPYRSVRFFIGPDRRARSPRSIRTRAPAIPPRFAPSTSCRTARRSTACTASIRTPGASSATPPSSATCIRSTTSTSAATGSSKAACATTRRPPRISTRTSSRTPTSATSWRATRNSPPTPP